MDRVPLYRANAMSATVTIIIRHLATNAIQQALGAIKVLRPTGAQECVKQVEMTQVQGKNEI
jgi:hypothetical protein